MLAARWSELQREVWTIPTHRVKNKAPHILPLPKAVLKILHGLPRAPDSDLWFPSAMQFGRRAYGGLEERASSGVTKAVDRLQKLMADEIGPFPRFTLHDLWRTAATRMQGLGLPLPVVEAVLNHVAGKGEKVGVSEEVQRALRNMSGLTVKREKGAEGRPVYRDQALELAVACQSEEEFRARVVELTRLDQRTRREIWIEDGGAKSAMQQLRALFRDVNNGRLPDVPMPRSIDLMVPGFGDELAGLSVSAVDTKGMDEITVRADLDTRLKDPRTHVVLCSTFNQAPSTSVQLLLDQLQEAHGIEVDTGKVSILALPRPGEAMAVKDDTGEPPADDEEGYQLKRDQILRHLGSGDTAFAKVPVFFFNAHDDPPESVRAALYGQIRCLREHEERRLQNECAAVEEVLHNHQQHAFSAAVQEVAKRLGHFLDAHRKVGARVRPVHQEIVDALNGTRYASTVWAMTRRNGEYYNFSVTHHLGSGCARDALLRTHQWFERLQGEIETLKQDPDLTPAGRTIGQIEASATAWRRNFAEAVRIAAIEVYREEVEEDGDLWVHCAGEWGQGQGFRDRVVSRLRQWFESRTDLNDELERIIANIWVNEVVSQMERLTKESWEQEAEKETVVPLLRKAG